MFNSVILFSQAPLARGSRALPSVLLSHVFRILSEYHTHFFIIHVFNPESHGHIFRCSTFYLASFMILALLLEIFCLITGKRKLTEELLSLPIVCHTLKQKQVKADIELKLSEIDDAMKIFSRPKVFIKIDH